jgi:beta-propeller repeat-containing protein
VTRTWSRGNLGFMGDYATVAYSTATGTTLWTARYHGPATSAGGVAKAVAVTPDGATVVVTGDNWSASPSSQPEFATVAYAAGTGAHLWVARLGRPQTQDYSASSVAVSPDSSTAFVTGTTGGSGGATVAYNS